MSDNQIPYLEVADLLEQGKVIAYPTEAVYGLGCDPDNADAVNKILAIKQRPMSKGLILIAADFEQLKPYIDCTALSEDRLEQIRACWPGPTTWVMPASANTAKWLTGDFASIAVRVTAHPTVQALCRAFGKPLVSTSANLSGQPAINNLDDLYRQMDARVDAIVPGKVDCNMQPSRIIDAVTGTIYRS